MIRWRPRGLPIAWQTLLLLLVSLVVTQLVSIALFLSLPAPRADFNRLGDIADVLANPQRERNRERALVARLQPYAPIAERRMTSNRDFTARLAERIGAPPTRVRLFFEPDQRDTFPSPRSRGDRVPMRRGEPLFFNTVIAGFDTGDGWRVVQTPPRALLGSWQRRSLIWLAVSALVMIPFAWAFARRITRPMRRFAEAAERLGSDPLAPPVPVEGPAELRVTAAALNRMQDRLRDYVAERTAMIGAIAHDLRTPLARIAFRIEAAPPEVASKVQADIEQMREMISATIGFVRGTTRHSTPCPVALDTLLGGIVAEEQEMGRPVTLARSSPLSIAGDASGLSRLFQNLIDNGVAYGGAVEVALAAEGGEAVVRFADRGPGIAVDQVDRLFEPFQRGDPSRNRETGGIGLGLTIARGIARDHGGTLGLEARRGGGLAAVCRFPLRG